MKQYNDWKVFTYVSWGGIVFILLIVFLSKSQSLDVDSLEERFTKKDYRGIVSDLTDFIKKQPYHVQAFIYRGRAKSELGDYFGAMSDLNTAIKLNPNEAEAYWIRGCIEHDNNSLDSAFQDYSKTISLVKKASSAYHNRAIILVKWGRYSDALENYNKAIQYSPDETLSYLNRGRLKLFHLSDKEGGCLDFSKAGELGSTEAYELIKMFCK
jgi:tetratricopeptide (TPR) repeat protein